MTDEAAAPAEDLELGLSGSELEGAGPEHVQCTEHRCVLPDGHDGDHRRRYDWTAVKRRYVEGVRNPDEGVVDWPTLQEVADHFGLPASRVREKSAMEAWREERVRWQAEFEARRRQAKAAAMSKEAVNLDGKALDAAKTGLQLCLAKLTEIGQQAQRRRSQTAGEGGLTGIDSQEQMRLAQAVDLWHKIGLRAIGDPETMRLEVTGAGGRPIEIATELKRDDPTRLQGVLSVLAQAGLGELFGGVDDAGRTLAARAGSDGVYTTEDAG